MGCVDREGSTFTNKLSIMGLHFQQSYQNGVTHLQDFRNKKILEFCHRWHCQTYISIRKHDHITPILMDLHWLPVNQRIQFKILLLTFKSLNGLAPVYIDEMIQRYVPNRKLRSSSAFLLKQNKWNLKSYGFRTFTVAAPFLWNSLPLEVKSSPSLNIFKSKLKTHLFKCAFNLNQIT